jgi:hypothetical protein
MRFRHYKNSGSLGVRYLFGLNIYKDDIGWTIDLIIGRHVFVVLFGK